MPTPASAARDDVATTVRLLEEAGAAAIQLEDQRRADKRCGHLAGKQVVDAGGDDDEDRRRGAPRRRDPATVIIGRCDSRGVHGLDDCLAPAARPTATPAPTGCFPRPSPRGTSSAAWAASSPAPCRSLANMTEFGASPLIPLAELAGLGFAAVLYPVTLLRLAMKAMEAGLGLIADEGTQESLLDLMQSRRGALRPPRLRSRPSGAASLRPAPHPPRSPRDDRLRATKPAGRDGAAFAKGLAGIVAGQTAICSLDGTSAIAATRSSRSAAAGDFEEVA